MIARSTVEAGIRSQNIKGTPPMRAKSVRHDLKNVMESASAAGLQEMKWAWYWVVLISMCNKHDWGRYPRVFKGAQSAQVVIWDRSVWERVDSWTRLLHGPVIGVCQARYMRAVRLRNRFSGKEIILKTTHYLPDRGGHARFLRIWLRANRRDRVFVEFLASFGVPVISTGDYNRRGHVLDPLSDDFVNDYLGPDAIDHVIVTQQAGRKRIGLGVSTVSHRLHLRTDHDGRVARLNLT